MCNRSKLTLHDRYTGFYHQVAKEPVHLSKLVCALLKSLMVGLIVVVANLYYLTVDVVVTVELLCFLLLRFESVSSLLGSELFAKHKPVFKV